MNLGNIPEEINYDFVPIKDIFNLVGVSFGDRQVSITKLTNSSKLELRRNPTNEYDKNAIKVLSPYNNETLFIGWIPRDIAAIIAPEMDAGIKWRCEIIEKLGNDDTLKGIRVKIFIEE